MNTIAGIFWGIVAGVCAAFGVIVLIQLTGAGSSLLGFTEWTFRYYMLCFGVCTAMLVMSKPARKQWGYMLIFFLAVVMVIAVGFQAFVGADVGLDSQSQMQANLLQMGVMCAKAVMYVAPGAVTVIYAVLALDGVSPAGARAAN